jgi:hypothetical protein
MLRKLSPAQERTEATPAPTLNGTDEPYSHQTWLFLALLFLSVVLRLALLISSRHYLRSDEAVVGMEALDIIEGRPIPLFLYGQSYGGGHTVEALLAIPWFAGFGSADYFLKLGPVMLSCVQIALLYLTLYRFFNKKFALLAATLFSCFATFTVFNYLVNGGMTTLLTGWLGLHLFLHAYFPAKEKPAFVVLSGVCLGLAYYFFDYALYYLFAVILLWALKEKLQLWRRWKLPLGLMLGFFVGASPLLYYNLTHDFENIKNLLSRTAQSNPSPFLGLLARTGAVFSHDLPAFFSLDIDDFAPKISPISYVSYGLFVFAVIYILVTMARPIFFLMRSLFTRRVTTLARHERIVYILLLLFLYLAIYTFSKTDLAIYTFSKAGGTEARHLAPLCPLIPIVLAWPIYHLGQRHLLPAVMLAGLFAGTQIYFLVLLARDKTTVEWRVVTHGEDIKALTKFLLDHNLTTVVTPYEIKWKLMFESRRKIVAAAYPFGFDRENKYNLEVIDRVNHQGFPLAIVFDKEYKLTKITPNFYPQGAFDLDGFHESLRKAHIGYRITPAGQDYIVYHDFSKAVMLAEPNNPPKTGIP